ncbi:SDR family oxidoreductase [Brachybacterium sp. DNPG3]
MGSSPGVHEARRRPTGRGAAWGVRAGAADCSPAVRAPGPWRGGPARRRLQRLIRPEEIANKVVSLASPLASAATGGALGVDGGYTDAILP